MNFKILLHQQTAKYNNDISENLKNANLLL